MQFFSITLFVNYPAVSDKIQLIHSVVIKLILLAAANDVFIGVVMKRGELRIGRINSIRTSHVDNESI